MVRVDVLTLFPEMFTNVIGSSMLRIAQQKNILEVHLHDLRDWTHDQHRSVDDRPFGGGPGMVLKVEPVVHAVRDISNKGNSTPRLLLASPEGRRLSQSWVRQLAKEPRLLLVAGHYEGYDERIIEILKPEIFSVGDYILTGGELPVLTVLDAVTRLLDGVLGDPESNVAESFGENGLLDHAHYTRPAEFEGHTVPDVLTSGDHARIKKWREKQAIARTREFRAAEFNDG